MRSDVFTKALVVASVVIAAYAGTQLAAREWTDTTGKFRIDAELVAVRNGKVILEKKDGSVITVPLDKLSAADQEFLKKQNSPPPVPVPEVSAPAASSPPAAKLPAALVPVASAPVTTVPPTADGLALAGRVEQVLKASCYRCHGEDGSSEGGFNFVLNLEKLARTVVKPKQPGASLLYERMSAHDESVMPPEGENPRPSAADVALIKQWIEAGAPAATKTKPREFITHDATVKAIRTDLEKASERSRRFLRYFTLTHLYNAGVSEDELQTFRNAFTKLINSLSWNTSLLIPEAVDPTRTVYRIDIRSLHWSGQIWESIEQANPYFLPLQTADAQACYDATETKMPYVRIDWFVFAASKPPLYHSVLGIPGSDRELEQMLRVNVEANIEQEQAIRAAFNRSGVSQHNRLIEWHKSPYGSYWKSYDFGGSTGRQNLFEHPLGPGNAQGSFQHDGGELIFTLPNGLQGYMLADANGKRIDQGPTSIVSDPKQPDRTVTNGVSCMSCHYTGVIPKTDEVGSAVRANPKAFEDSADILALYRDPRELNQVLDNDSRRFAEACSKIGIGSLSRSGEPVSAMALRFQQEVDLPLAAAEFGLPPDEFTRRLDSASTTARALAPLRVPGGTLKRDVFVVTFAPAVDELRVVSGTPAPATAAQPFARTSAAAVSAIPSRPGAAPLAAMRTSDNKPGEVRRFPDMRWGVKSLAFSPDGRFLAAGKMDRALLMFDVPGDARVEYLEDLDLLRSVECCRFTPSGSHLLVAGESGHIKIYEVSREGRLKETGQFVGHTGEVNCLAISSDGRFAVSGGGEKKLRYWEIANHREQATIAGFEGDIKACHIARNGRTAMATDGAQLFTIELTKGEVVRKLPLTRSPYSVKAAAFSAEGDFFAIAESRSIRVWNLASARDKEMNKLDTNESVECLTFTPDGTRLLAGGRSKVDVWDFRKGKRIASLATNGTLPIEVLAASPDNRHCAAIPDSAGQVLQVFSLPNAER